MGQPEMSLSLYVPVPAHVRGAWRVMHTDRAAFCLCGSALTASRSMGAASPAHAAPRARGETLPRASRVKKRCQCAYAHPTCARMERTHIHIRNVDTSQACRSRAPCDRWAAWLVLAARRHRVPTPTHCQCQCACQYHPGGSATCCSLQPDVRARPNLTSAQPCPGWRAQQQWRLCQAHRCCSVKIWPRVPVLAAWLCAAWLAS
jgi:hypothetical protein